jgi:hypothetical protein
VLIVIDRWNVPDSLAYQLRDCGVVHVSRMFERISARTDGVARTVGPVGVDRDFVAHRVRRVDDRLDLFERDGPNQGTSPASWSPRTLQ